jgi:translation initiation factor IF-2
LQKPFSDSRELLGLGFFYWVVVMIEVYRVKNRFRFSFVKVMADKVTDRSVFVKGSRVSKSSDGVRYFDDFHSAREYAKTLLSRELEIHQKDVNRVEEDLKNLQSVDEENIKVSSELY